ncbi:MAG TPA: STAS domain-containing protein [Povalibacter sp.]
MKNAAAKNPAKSPKRKRAAASAELSAPAMTAKVAEAAAPVLAPVPVLSGQDAIPTVCLASSCTVKDASSIKQSLSAFTAHSGQVVIDASGVERVDTAIIQLLYAFVRDRLASDREVQWRTPSVAFLDAARLLGVRDLLNVPRTPEAAV